jgi:hypothetical protein
MIKATSHNWPSPSCIFAFRCSEVWANLVLNAAAMSDLYLSRFTMSLTPNGNRIIPKHLVSLSNGEQTYSACHHEAQPCSCAFAPPECTQSSTSCRSYKFSALYTYTQALVWIPATVPRCFVVCTTSPFTNARYCLKVGHDRFRSHPFHLLLTDHQSL